MHALAAEAIELLSIDNDNRGSDGDKHATLRGPLTKRCVIL
jgi:hypothetical protein